MRRLYKSKKDVKIYGICAGIANCFDLDPTIVRIVAVLLMFTTGFLPVLAGYFIGYFIIPEEEEKE